MRRHSSTMYRWVILRRTSVQACRFGPNCQSTVGLIPTVRYLHALCDFFTVRKNLCQVLVTQDVPEGGLGQQPRSSVCIGDVSNSQSSVLDPVVHHTINIHCHRVFGQNLKAGQ